MTRHDELSDTDLDSMLERVAATTPGPWVSHFEGRDHWGGDSFIGTSAQDIYIHAQDYAGGGGHFAQI